MSIHLTTYKFCLLCLVCCLVLTSACSPVTKSVPVVASPVPSNPVGASLVPTRPSPTATINPPTAPQELAKVLYNLPQATLTETTGLYASPNRGEFVAPVQIAAGDFVYVMGRNGTSSHLRVVWNTGVGWVPTSFTNYNADRAKLNSLPVFKREPPACAVYLATQFSLNSEYRNEDNDKKRIAVVVDLFRSQYGDFPQSSLALKVNGTLVESSRRQIVEQGQFSLKDVVFTIPGYIQLGDTVGYYLETTSTENLTFMATLFSVPENCVWKTD